MNEDNNKKEDSTSEINLKDLYDGRINSTVIMDPVTQNEVLIKEKKKYVFIYIILLFVAIILGCYFLYYKTDIIKKRIEVKPNVTTTKKNVKPKVDNSINGDLNCTYTNKSDDEDITSSVKFVIENSNVLSANYLISVISKTDHLSENAKKMLDSYEKMYINNVSLIGNESLFEKNEKDFSLSLSVDYNTIDFDSIVIDSENIKLFIKPSKDDSYYVLSDNYVNLGYSCTLTRKVN